MTQKKAILFIDGSNFYHAAKQNNVYGLFQYKEFIELLRKEYSIQRVYYYDAIKDRTIEPKQYAAQQAFHARLQKAIPDLIIRSRKLRYIPQDKKMGTAKHHAQFCNNCVSKIDSFLKDAGLMKRSREKGVDIKLVTDMIKGAFQERYDAALLATGDADFVPAVEVVQNMKKEVVNLHFYAGSAHELRAVCNSHKLVVIDSDGTHSLL